MAASSEKRASTHRSRRRFHGSEPLVMTMILLIAVIARVAVVVVQLEDDLSDDRDGYLAYAQGLAERRVFSENDTPSAYRPPLYPILLVPISSPGAAAWRGNLHILLGALTVWWTYLLGRRLRLGRAAAVGALLVAVDPLLLRYTAYLMTETLAACLVTGLLLAMTSKSQAPLALARPERQMAAGLLFGLCALCRPTVWAFAGLMGLWIALSALGALRETLRSRNGVAQSRQVSAPTSKHSPYARVLFRRREARPQSLRSVWSSLIPWWSMLAASLVLAPWVIRNMIALGSPILMTTHGGYTLLLGNNQEFFDEVVDAPWGTVWDESRLTKWQADNDQAMLEEGVEDELARDRWMTEQAIDYIVSYPGNFLKACRLRFTRFWNVVPISSEVQIAPWVPWTVVLWMVGGWFTLVFLGAILGLWRILRDRSRQASWAPCLLMLAAFFLVHLVYWTNARMRAPVVPVIALLAAAGWWPLLRGAFTRRGSA